MDKKFVFEIIEPDRLTSALVLNSPHSGCDYPDIFLNQTSLSREQLRRGEDTAVDGLFSRAVPEGGCFISALFPRSFVDANREPFELDPDMFDGKLPGFANTRSVRVKGGLGVIPQIMAENIKLYCRKLPVKEALLRIEDYHKPYHAALSELLERVRKKQGFSILLDCHSMPSLMSDKSHVKDIVLGDRFGASCSPILTETFEAETKKLGYTVARNVPYAGGYITEHYGKPGLQSHSLQIEINRALYMDEKTLRLNSNFSRLQDDLSWIIDKLDKLHAADLAPFSSAPCSNAAE